jgi:hypothetical protein
LHRSRVDKGRVEADLIMALESPGGGKKPAPEAAHDD